MPLYKEENPRLKFNILPSYFIINGITTDSLVSMVSGLLVYILTLTASKEHKAISPKNSAKAAERHQVSF